MTRLTTRALNRALLARQHLLEPAALTPLELVDHLAGLQAQNLTAPYFGIWTRLRSVTTQDISELIEARQVVRIAMMRSTVHLVTAADCLGFRRLLDPAVGRGLTGGSGFGRALAGVDRTELAAVADAALADGPLGNPELVAVLRRAYPDVDREALLIAVRADLPLVQVPPRGLWARSGGLVLATADRWLGRPLAPVDAAAAAALIRRYLAAFGPAGIQDMQAWSGLTRLGEVVATIRDELMVFTDEAGTELFDLPAAPRPDPETAAAVRLVPEFDNLLLGHADRSRIIHPDHRPRVYSVNGIIAGTVLVDGFVGAVWKFRRTGRTASIELTPLVRIGARDRRRIEREALRALNFALPDGGKEVRFG